MFRTNLLTLLPNKAYKTLKKAYFIFWFFFSKFSNRRRILFHGTTTMHYLKFKPIYDAIKKYPRNQVYFCFTKNKSVSGKADIGPYIENGVPEDKILDLQEAQSKKWDAVIDADYYTPWFSGDSFKIQIFHGIANKKIIINGEAINYGFHPNLKNYDLCFFINETHYNSTKSRGLWKNNKAGEIVGMCCLDELAKNNNPEIISKIKKKYIPLEYRTRKVLLYAPTWGEHTSWGYKKDDIFKAIADMDIFLIIKPHPLCINNGSKGDRRDFYSYISQFFTKENYVIVTGAPQEAMVISDAMITDYGSIIFEYALLHRPIFLYIGNNFNQYIADREQANLLFNFVNIFREGTNITSETFSINEVTPDQHNAMGDVEKKYFSNFGNATNIAIKILEKRRIIV